MTRPGPTLALLLAGCSLGLDAYAPEANPGGLGDADTDTDTDSDTDSDADGDADYDVELTGVSPTWGTTAGGLEVTISGGPFDDPTVTFGGEAGSVVSSSETSVVVLTPPYSGVDPSVGRADVDVVVENADGATGGAEEAFTWYEDGAGMAGAVGALHWIDYVGDYAWTGSTQDAGEAELWFVSPPRDMHYWDLFASELDACVSAESYDPESAVGTYEHLDLGADQITLSASGGAGFALAYDASSGEYLTDAALTTTDMPAGTNFALDTVTSTFAPEPLSESVFARSASTFALSSPGLGGTTFPIVRQDSLSIQWTGGTAGELVIIEAELIPTSGPSVETVHCVVSDTGSFLVPSSAWTTTWPVNYFLYLRVGRVLEVTSTLPYNDAESRIAGIYWIHGVAKTN